MNLWLTDPFAYPEKPLQRGKVLDAADLERLGQFERYRDVDGDGVCYRTLPGTEHPLAAYFTRGTGHNEKSGYSERPEDWKKNLDRLACKLETARGQLPAPVIEGDREAAGRPDRLRLDPLAPWSRPATCSASRASRPSYCRIRALPSPTRSTHFVARHERVYVVEQNRDGQVASLLRVDARRHARRPPGLGHPLQRHADRRREHRPADPRLGEEPHRPRLADRRRRARQPATSRHDPELSPE